MDLATLAVDFTKFSADDLMLARRGQIAARAGAPFDRTMPEAWQAGWQLGEPERWTHQLRDALAPSQAKVAA